MSECSRCGAANPEGARFCNVCGEAFDLEERPREVRKTVTALFCDVVGSTTIAESMDAESYRQLMTRFFAEMAEVVGRYGGTLDKFVGDAVKATFGVPIAHEDDAFRAVTAAIEMRAALAKLNEEFRQRWGVQISTRTGINTGEVVAGVAIRGQDLLLGDAMNMTARLESAAAPDEILLGSNTYLLVKDAVEAEPVGSLKLKGKSQAVEAYRLRSVIPGVPPMRRHLERPMVDRERERDVLLAAYRRVVEKRSCELVVVLGAPGIGKSRLVSEVTRDLKNDVRILVGRCLSFGEGITFLPVREVIRRLIAVDDTTDAKVVRQKLDSLLVEEDARPAVVAHAANLLGVEGGTSSSEELFWAVRRLLQAVARDRPLIVVFEDIHWASATLIDLIEHIADWSRDAPILVLCTARPEFRDARVDWTTRYETLLLRPLQKHESEEMMRNLLSEDIDQTVMSRIVEAAGGNPLFIEQTLSMLLETAPRSAGLEKEPRTLASIPPSIQALLAARLDMLPSPERQVIELAAVVGDEFSRHTLEVVASPRIRTELDRHLKAVARKELIRPVRWEVPGEEIFRFDHFLVRSAAYEATPKETRAALHERLADWMEMVAQERAGDFDEIVGYHLEQAHRCRSDLAPGDVRLQVIGKRAAQHLESASRGALARGDIAASVNLLDRSVALLPRDDRTRLDLLPDLGAALMEAGELQRAQDVLDEAIEAGDRLKDERARAHAAIPRAQLEILVGHRTRVDAARSEAERAVAVFQSAGDELGLARGWRLLAAVSTVECHFASVTEILEEAATHARRAGDERILAEILAELAGALRHGPSTAPLAISRCHRILDQVKGRGTEAEVLMDLAALYAMRGEFEEARSLLSQAKAMVEDLGVRLGWTGQTAGFVELLADAPERAEHELRLGLEQLRQMGERGYLSFSAALLAQALYVQERYDEAGQILELSEGTAAAEDIAPQARAKGLRAKLLARKDLHEKALSMAQQALDLVEPTDFANLHADTLVDMADVLAQGGDRRGAVARLRKAQRIYELKGNIVSATKTKTLVLELGAG